MIKRVPHYYKDFTCIASKCKNNCCAGGWQIEIDDDTVAHYSDIEGPFGKKLMENIIDDGILCFNLKDGKCPFLDENRLCEIYQELGEESLGVVCSQFPRYTEYFGNIKETGIGLACEEAERIIFSDKDSFHLDCEEISEEECPDSEFDSQLAGYLFPVRDRIFELIEVNDIPLHKKLVVLIWLLHDIQTAVNSNDTEETEELSALTVSDIMARYSTYLNQADYCADIQMCLPDGSVNAQSSMEMISEVYDGLFDVLNEEWESLRDSVIETLHGDYGNELTHEQYLQELTDFCQYLRNEKREYEYENLLKYFVFRYFLKAAYDHDVYGKAQLIVSNYLMILEMDLTKWLLNDRKFTFEDRIDTVQIFSRQVEYSDDNICQLAEEFMFDGIFKPENLSALLLSLPC
jgi:lysine-N-methylase